MPHEATANSGTSITVDRSPATESADFQISLPTAEDAAEIHGLIASCPPLDQNSLYANLIQCTHFARHCAVARSKGRVVGWISGHLPPQNRDTYFLWQVAVHPDMRGKALARHMLASILSRPEQSGIKRIETSITRSNEASWALFRSLSGWLKAPMHAAPWFDRERHLAGQHASEHLVTIGPITAPSSAG
jgi:L-2,4-diaminobutyric acid acetyltransferase